MTDAQSQQSQIAGAQSPRSVVGLASRLRTGTADAHRRTECAFGFAQIQDDSLTVEVYEALLRRLCAIYAPAERAIAGFVAAATPAFSYHAKRHYLISALHALGAALPSERECELAICNQEQCVALLYVLEGSTLGGKLIARRVQARLGLGSDALRFFDPYGSECVVRWRATQCYIEDVVECQKLDEERVLAQANAVFAWFGSSLDVQP